MGTTSRALSLRQPWAWLLAGGLKDIENRTWRTWYRGRFFIHASKTFDDAAYVALLRQWDGVIDFPDRDEFERGGIVGAATVVDCVRWHASPWFTGPFGFVIEDAVRLRFTPWRGMLNFFTVEGPVEEELLLG